MESNYQIRFVTSDGCGSYEYVKTDSTDAEEITQLIVDKANEYHDKKVNDDLYRCMFTARYKPIRKVKAVEMKYKEVERTDRSSGKKVMRKEWFTKRGGLKVTLAFRNTGYIAI